MAKKSLTGLILGTAILMLSFPLNSFAAGTRDIYDIDDPLTRWWKDSFIRFGGVAQFHFAYDLEDDQDTFLNDDDEIEELNEDLGEMRFKFSTFIDIKPWPNSRLHLSIWGMRVIAGRNADVSVTLDRHNRLPSEAYLLQSIWKFDITVGYQSLKWGSNEFLSPTDNINPLDLRGFIDPDREDISIPIPLAKAMFFITDFIFVEGIVIPFFVPGKFHQFSTDYALCQEDVCPLEDDEVIEFMGPDTWEGAWEYGVRIRAQVSDFIFEASYFHTREDFPVYLSVPNDEVIYLDVIIQSNFPEYDVAGGGIAWRYKKFALRAEGAFSPAREFATLPEDENGDPLSFVNARGRERPVIHSGTSSYLTWAVEAEYNPSRRLYLMAGYNEFIISDHIDFLLISSNFTNIALLMIRATALRERLTFKVGVIYFLQDDEYILAPRFTYQVSNQVELSVGANIMEGERGGNEDLGGIAPVSLFSKNDNAFVGIRYSY